MSGVEVVQVQLRGRGLCSGPAAEGQVVVVVVVFSF